MFVLIAVNRLTCRFQQTRANSPSRAVLNSESQRDMQSTQVFDLAGMAFAWGCCLWKKTRCNMQASHCVSHDERIAGLEYCTRGENVELGGSSPDGF